MIIKPNIIKNPKASDRNMSFLSIKSTLFKREKKVAPTSRLANSFIEPILADTILGAQNEVISAQRAIRKNKIINGRPIKLMFRFWILNITNPARLAKIASRVMPLGARNPIIGKISAILAKKRPIVFEDLKVFIINRLTTISMYQFTV
ncbi:MAG: hypothetical protein ISQ90_09525 [Rhodospirillales bacterium]|nr:hypothetical protein [Rhodospirillales bacterium]